MIGKFNVTKHGVAQRQINKIIQYFVVDQSDDPERPRIVAL